MTEEAVKTLEHCIEGPRKPVLQEKQVFLVLYHSAFLPEMGKHTTHNEKKRVETAINPPS